MYLRVMVEVRVLTDDDMTIVHEEKNSSQEKTNNGLMNASSSSASSSILLHPTTVFVTVKVPLSTAKTKPGFFQAFVGATSHHSI
jgi:hypothetical protein